MTPQSSTETPPEIDLDRLLAAVRRLDERSRVQVARALAESEMDARLDALIEELAASEPAAVSDAEILDEIQAVRSAGRCSASS